MNDVNQPGQDSTFDDVFSSEKTSLPTIQSQSPPPPSPVPEEEAPVKKPEKKVFTRNDVKHYIETKIHFPVIYPDYEPFVFRFRFKLSREAEEGRQQYLSLSAVEATAKVSEQALNEVCDLLTELPKGFGDLQDTGKGPGHSFRSYVETATDSDMKEFLRMVVEGADGSYWGAVAPREFRG